MKRHFLFLLTCFLGFTASAQLQQVTSLYLLNPNPCQSGTVEVIAETSFNTSGCWLVGSVQSCSGGNCQIDANYCRGALQTFSFCKDTFSLGVLAPGNYSLTFNLYQTDSWSGCQAFQWADSAVLSFTIGATSSTVTLPGDSVDLAGDTLGLCPGSTITLSGPTSGSATYQWFSGGIPLPGGGGPTLLINGPGSYALALTDCGTTDTSGTVVVVQAGTTPNQGNVPDVCESNASPVALTGGTPVGGWYSGAFVMNDSLDIAAAGPGTHNFWYVYEDQYGCRDSAMGSITVLGGPAVSHPPIPSICESNFPPMPLPGGLPSGGWYSGPFVVNDSFDVAAAGPGLHNIWYVYEDQNGCRDSVMTAVTVNALPSAPAITQVGDSLMSSSASGNVWMDSTGAIPGATGQYFVPPGAGTYWVQVIDSNGCASDTSAPYTYTFVAMLDAAPFLDFKVHSSESGWELRWGGVDFGPLELELADLRGRSLWKGRLEGADHRTGFGLEMPGLAEGVYLWRLRQGERVRVVKVMKW
ncbi:MAG: hypothetical protein AAF570_12775 [Bacteroidota bacterium]